MLIAKPSFIGLILSVMMPFGAAADDMMMSHGSASYPIYHTVLIETESGRSEGESVFSWDIDALIGTDYNKVRVKSEGETRSGNLESAEFWGLYSRNITEFWDTQIGLRYDRKPTSTAYAVFGLSGLAPYGLETDAHGFISEHGDFTARIKTETDFLITQKLVLQPYAEINLSAQKVEEQDIGAGMTDGQIGLQTRYDITKRFAPYVDIHYGQKFGATKSIAETDNAGTSETGVSVGLRLMF